MTAAGTAEAEKIARKAVEKELAVCVNIVPKVRSSYRWQGEVEEASEVLMLFKTTHKAWPKLKKRIRKWHSYDVPEILKLSIEEGDEEYLKWISHNVG